MSFSGKDLIAWGLEPGAWFPQALTLANTLHAQGQDLERIEAAVAALQPVRLSLRDEDALSFGVNIEATTEAEKANVDAVLAHMRALMRIPTVVEGAVMPDACPASHALGTIPVGGVVATKDAIHPGFHSADICCSVAISIVSDVSPKAVLDQAHARTHFGPGGRTACDRVAPPAEIMAEFADNPFLTGLETAATEHFATQGDGNHFFYVGQLRSTGQVAIVTHHGSRKPGAMLYKRGLAAAETWRKRLSPQTPQHSAWIPSTERQGQDYWRALQTLRAWTKASHFAIHDLVVHALGIKVLDRFWNEHNFVFERNGLYYHAKGATPAWAEFAADSVGLTLIPLNMAEPILIARGLDAAHAVGFAPHGAGRNFGRKSYLRQLGDADPQTVIGEQTRGIDVRFWCGLPDLSELPGAYKTASTVRDQIERFGLAEIVDEVVPYGSIMAGDWEQPFRAARFAKRAERRQA